jgi:shikimate dehydrogenase
MMSACFKSLGLSALYAAFYVDELEKDLDLLHKTGFSGLSVTLPYKEMACRLVERIDTTARQIGAANTLRRTDLGWEGCNTDWTGALKALASACELRGRRALIVGAGGAARAVAYGLKQAGAHVTIANRCVERGRSFSKQIEAAFIPLSLLEKSGDKFDVVVQCTSSGLSDERATPLVSGSFFKPEMTVMDIVYSPPLTAFSRAARDAGATVVSGLEMLLYQGVAQLEWWLERPVFDTPAVDAMRRALEEAVNDKTE